MARTVYYTATSFNGRIADEHGSLEWLFAVDTGEAASHLSFMDTVGAIVEGSTTYRWCLDHGETDFTGGRWPTFVFSSRTWDHRDGADVRFRSGPVADTYQELADAAGERDLWVVGGGDLAGQFLDAGLLDEIVLDVAPVALAGGAELLPRRIESSQLLLRDVRQVGQFAHLTYDLRR